MNKTVISKLLKEGHLDLSRKLDKALTVENEKKKWHLSELI